MVPVTVPTLSSGRKSSTKYQSINQNSQVGCDLYVPHLTSVVSVLCAHEQRSLSRSELCVIQVENSFGWFRSTSAVNPSLYAVDFSRLFVDAIRPIVEETGTARLCQRLFVSHFGYLNAFSLASFIPGILHVHVATRNPLGVGGAHPADARNADPHL